MKRTKIVCTIGPASRSPEMLEQLAQSGMDVVRLNFSHGTHAEHGEVIASVREISRRLARPIAVIQDLSGPKVRLGEIDSSPVTIKAGAELTLTARDVIGNDHEISVTYADLARDVKSGDTILLSDGALELEVLETEGPDVRCRVVVGGQLSSRKAVNLPDGSVSIPTLTDKDYRDLDFGLEQNVDYVALSFVRNADDVLAARKYIESSGRTVPLIAKIEKHEAVANISEIINVVDGIMVARGDLGVETPLEEVPLLQKMLIDETNRANKPVITATHMLASMVDNPRPTRAEAADVANAVLDGTDAVMLSEETAVGSYPLEAVKTMAAVAEHAEQVLSAPHRRDDSDGGAENSVSPAAGRTACALAKEVNAAVIVSYTRSGGTALAVAAGRPRQPILALTPVAETYNRLGLVWGVAPTLVQEIGNTDEMADRALEMALQSGLARQGQLVVITAGVPNAPASSTNMVRVERL